MWGGRKYSIFWSLYVSARSAQRTHLPLSYIQFYIGQPRNSQHHKPHSLPLVSASLAQRVHLLRLYFQLKILESANPTTVSTTNPDILC